MDPLGIFGAVTGIHCGLAQHEPGCRWVDSMSRAKTYRRVTVFEHLVDYFQSESTSSAVCSTVNK